MHRPGDVDGRPGGPARPRLQGRMAEPILDPVTFDAGRRILTDRRRLNLGDNRLATPLSALAWCGACGGRLVSAPMRTGRTDGG